MDDGVRDVFVLDTNFILNYLNGAPGPARFLETKDDPELWISDITRLELLSYPLLDAEEKGRIMDFLEHVEILPVLGAVGDIAIEFRKATRRKLPDSIIAATAVYLGAPLVTGDKELCASTFEGFSALTFPRPAQQ